MALMSRKATLALCLTSLWGFWLAVSALSLPVPEGLEGGLRSEL